MTAFQLFLCESLESSLPRDLLSLLPHGWQKYGEIALLNLHRDLYPYRKTIADQALLFFQKIRLKAVAVRIGPTEDELRVPKIEILAGENDPIILHKENGCIYRFDITQVTFSNGNHYERKRLIKKIETKSRVIDLFACIGNLSVGLAVHKKSYVIGIELNPLAYSYLCNNLILNRINHLYTPILGDNRHVTPKFWADHVLMGYWGLDEQQRLIALQALKKSGGWLYFHELAQKESQLKAQKQMESTIEENKLPFLVHEAQSKRIKWVAPKIAHWVTDIKICPKLTL